MITFTVAPQLSQPDLSALAGFSDEVLLQHQQLARVGHLDDDALINAAETVNRTGLRAILVWDVLSDDAGIAGGGALIRRIPEGLIAAVRVQDPGVAFYMVESFPHIPIQLVLETGNHNLGGITSWIKQLSPERVILSNEIPLPQIKEMRPHIKAQVEIMALGRLLIFYTPRKLLAPIDPAEDGYDHLQRYVTSEEDRKRFPILENRHGTFMYYEKDLFLLPYLNEIEEAGIDAVRIDLRFFEDNGLVQSLTDWRTGDSEALDKTRSYLGPKVTRGFFKSNRTDKQFAKLRNPNLFIKEDLPYLGVVLETRKKQFLAIETRVPFKVGDQLEFHVPEGDVIQNEITWIRDISKSNHQSAEPGLWLIGHVPRVSSGTRVYFSRTPQ